MTATSDFRDNGCGFSGFDAGQTGESLFSVVESSDCPVEGVKDGTQKFEAPLFEAAI